jgi:hypothetical protein
MLSPEIKGGFPYIQFIAGYRNEGCSLSHTWSHTISPFNAQTHFWVKEHHLDLGVYNSTISLHEQLSAQHIYLSFDIEIFSQARPLQVFSIP